MDFKAALVLATTKFHGFSYPPHSKTYISVTVKCSHSQSSLRPVFFRPLGNVCCVSLGSPSLGLCCLQLLECDVLSLEEMLQCDGSNCFLLCIGSPCFGVSCSLCLWPICFRGACVWGLHWNKSQLGFVHHTIYIYVETHAVRHV